MVTSPIATCQAITTAAATAAASSLVAVLGVLSAECVLHAVCTVVAAIAHQRCIVRCFLHLCCVYCTPLCPVSVRAACNSATYAATLKSLQVHKG
jgi:hypothetical protein